jgi:hypothetical protein
MSNWASCTESDSLLLPEGFGEALLVCQILFCQVRFSPSSPLDRERKIRGQLRNAADGVERTAEADDLLAQADRIDAIAEEMRLAGRPLHVEFAAEAMRRRELARCAISSP